MSVAIYHNPACGTSRNVLAIVRASGEEPVLTEYLLDPPSRERLAALFAAAGITLREGMRAKGNETLIAKSVWASPTRTRRPTPCGCWAP